MEHLNEAFDIYQKIIHAYTQEAMENYVSSPTI